MFHAPGGYKSLSSLRLLAIALAALLILALQPAYALAQSATGNPSGLPLPRFVTTRSTPINVRVGPGTKYDIAWVYVKAGLPVEIVQEFDTWRKIHDVDGEEGWVHQSLLSGNRHVLVQGNTVITLYKKPDSDARPVAQVEPGVVAKLNECADTWCQVSAGGFEGWLLKTSLWGVYEHEESE